MAARPVVSRRPRASRDAFDDALFAAIAESLRSQEKTPTPVVVAGGVGAGKTQTGLRVAQRLRQDGISVGGILAPRLFEKGETTGYNVLDLLTGEDAAFARSDPPGDVVGRFYIRPGGLAFADRALRQGIERASVVFIDEIGRWETSGGGHAAALRDVLRSNALPVLFVRAEMVDRVSEVFGLGLPRIVRLAEAVHRDSAAGRRDFWDIVDSVPYPLLITMADDRFPQSRPMTVVARDDHTLWLPTSRGSRKVAQITAHGEVTVVFVDTDRFNYASFHGAAALDPDRDTARRLWSDDWSDDWPGGADDPDYALLRVDGIRGFYLRGTTGEAGEIDLRRT